MVLLGRVWNSLDANERLLLLQHCKAIRSATIKQFESELSWNKLMPVTQEGLLKVDFSDVLGRDVTP